MSYYPPGQPGPFQPPPMATAAPYTPPPTPADGLAIATTILLAIMALLSLVVAAAGFNEYAVVDDIISASGDSTIEDLFDADDGRAAGLGFFYLGWIGTGIVFVCWQYRHSRNAQSLAGPGGLGPPWAIAGWFIPFAGLVLPGIELYQSSQASSPPVPGGGPRSGKGSGLVIAWIVAFALGSLLPVGQLVRRHAGRRVRGHRAGRRPDAARASEASAAWSWWRRRCSAAIMVQSLTRKQTQRINQVYGGGMFVPWGAQPPPAWGPAQPAPPWGAAPPPQDQAPWGAPPGAPPPPGPGGPAPWPPPTQ